MKILIATTTFKSNQLEAITKNLVNLYSELSQQVTITFLIPVQQNDFPEELPFYVQSYANSKRYGSCWSLLTNLFLLKRRLKTKETLSHDVLHIHVAFAIELFFLGKTLRKLNVPVITTIWQPCVTFLDFRTLVSQRSLSLFRQALPHVLFNASGWNNVFRKAVNSVNLLLVASAYQLQQLKGYKINCRILQLPNGVQPSCVSRAKLIYGEQRKLRILYIGHNTPSKGVDDLIGALCKLRNLPIQLTLALSDRGNKSRIAGMIKKRKLENQVHLKGKVDVYEEMANHDIFVVPYKMPIGVSYYPNVILECFAAGLPAVSTDWPVMRELFGGLGDDLLVPCGDINRLAVKIEELASQPERLILLQNEFSRRYKNRYSLDVWAKQQLDIYMNLIEVK